MVRIGVLVLVAAGLASCGGGSDALAEVRPGTIGAATFTASTFPPSGVYTTSTGQLTCATKATEADRQKRLAEVAAAGIDIQATACVRYLAVLLAMCGIPDGTVWLVHASAAPPEQMRALGFFPLTGPTSDQVFAPCAAQ